MSRSPYRLSTHPHDGGGEAVDRPGREDRELLPVFLVVWIACVVRVGSVAVQQEPVEGEAALAGLVLLALPYMMWKPAISIIRDGLSR